MKLYAVILAALLSIGAALPAAAEGQDFSQWLTELKRDATGQGVPASVVDNALNGVTPLPRVLELDRRQPETTLTLSEYLSRVLVPERIKEGRQLKLDNRPLLRAVSDRYGVSPKSHHGLVVDRVELWQGDGEFPRRRSAGDARL
jgi:membrane-bound lytic murein transglycosylase B